MNFENKVPYVAAVARLRQSWPNTGDETIPTFTRDVADDNIADRRKQGNTVVAIADIAICDENSI